MSSAPKAPVKEATEKEAPVKKTRQHYDCAACPAYCCSIYGRVIVSKPDLKRLAKHAGISSEKAAKRYTSVIDDERVLKRRKDAIFGEACRFLDPQTRGCTIYESRPDVCRDYPGQPRCVYYDMMQFEQGAQDEPSLLPVVRFVHRDN